MNSLISVPAYCFLRPPTCSVSSAESLAGLLVAFADVNTMQKEVDWDEKIR